jgi:hypothetical protein
LILARPKISRGPSLFSAALCPASSAISLPPGVAFVLENQFFVK